MRVTERTRLGIQTMGSRERTESSWIGSGRPFVPKVLVVSLVGWFIFLDENRVKRETEFDFEESLPCRIYSNSIIRGTQLMSIDSQPVQNVLPLVSWVHLLRPFPLSPILRSFFTVRLLHNYNEVKDLISNDKHVITRATTIEFSIQV